MSESLQDEAACADSAGFIPGGMLVSAGDPQSLSTSVSLLQGLRAQQAGAWTCFVRLYGPLLYTWCRRRGVQADDAADVVQEVCRSVHRRIGDFKHSSAGAFRTWLWTIARHKIVDLLRARRTPAVGGGQHHETLQHIPAEPVVEEAEPTYDGDRAALMRRALKLIEPEFEPRSWRAFWRSAVEGKHTSHIAADLKMTPAAVRKAKSRVLQRLRIVLADLGEDLDLA